MSTIWRKKDEKMAIKTGEQNDEKMAIKREKKHEKETIKW